MGGDFFDFIPVTDRIHGIAIADASGHGLPAALQVRDVYTGLRMGVARDFKIVRTVERLNRIIHQSRMTTKFVSLFYGEIEEEGNLIYVNAGHPPPLHFHSKGVTTLKQTGMVLGPSATASYSRGFLALEPGDALLLYTDGMTEASDPKGREFGIERLKKAFLAIKESRRTRSSVPSSRGSVSTSASAPPRTTGRWSSSSGSSRRSRLRRPHQRPRPSSVASARAGRRGAYRRQRRYPNPPNRSRMTRMMMISVVFDIVSPPRRS